jgi:endonuclease/exonuclease/phosphatase family metal-dependent hydrolase
MASRWLWVCATLLLLQGCRAIDNYTDPQGPRFSGDHAEQSPKERAIFKVVSFNIAFGEQHEQAVEEILATPELSEADALLLQEMDPDGVQAMAQALRHNYVYYPASVHKHGKDFGNAVLSPWPIVADAKLILPHLGPHDGGMKAAVRATVELPSVSVVLISAHTETPWLGPRGRLDQSRTIIASVVDEQRPVVVAGDFNTVDPGSVEATVDLYGEAGFGWASEEAGSTVGDSPVDFALDHVFVRGFSASRSGTAPTEASDHRPVWVELTRGSR